MCVLKFARDFYSKTHPGAGAPLFQETTFSALPRAENGMASEPCLASEERPRGGAFLSFPFHLSRCRRARTEGLSRVRGGTDGQWAARLSLGFTLPKLSGIASEEVPCSPEKTCSGASSGPSLQFSCRTLCTPKVPSCPFIVHPCSHSASGSH